jgi:hypothetical protein
MRARPGASQALCDAPAPENCPIALTRTLVVELEQDNLGVEQPAAAFDQTEHQGGKLHETLGKAGLRSKG